VAHALLRAVSRLVSTSRWSGHAAPYLSRWSGHAAPYQFPLGGSACSTTSTGNGIFLFSSCGPIRIECGKDAKARIQTGGVDRLDIPRPIAAFLFGSSSSRRADFKVEIPNAIEIRFINDRQVDSCICQAWQLAGEFGHGHVMAVAPL
jgi:hypothetical protein